LSQTCDAYRGSLQRTKTLWLVNSLPLNTVIHYHKIVRINGQLVYLTRMKVVNRERTTEFVIVASFKPDPWALTTTKTTGRSKQCLKILNPVDSTLKSLMGQRKRFKKQARSNDPGKFNQQLCDLPCSYSNFTNFESFR